MIAQEILLKHNTDKCVHKVLAIQLQLLCHTLEGAIKHIHWSDTEIHLGRNTDCTSLVPQRKKKTSNAVLLHSRYLTSISGSP